MKINKNDCTLVAESLKDELIQDITGNNEEWLFGKVPSENVMIGMIDGAMQESSILKGEEVDDKKFKTIPSIGLRFRVPKETNSIKIKINGKLFYRIKPTFTQQLKFLLSQFNGKEGLNVSSKQELLQCIENIKKENKDAEPRESIVQVNESIMLNDFGLFDFDINDDKKSTENINAQLSKKIADAIDLIRTKSVGYKNTKLLVSELLDESRYDDKILAYQFMAVPNWNFQLYLSVERYEKYNEVLVQLVNFTDKIAKSGSYETAIFNGGLEVQCNEGFKPFHFNATKHYYTDKPELPAIGNNCTINVISNTVIATENIPVYRQHRVLTNDNFVSYIEFNKLINDPIANLSFIHKKMVEKLNSYKLDLTYARNHEIEEYVNGFEKEVNDFEFEINRFKYGIELINNKSDVRKAFELMNRTFALNKNYSGWRMFQIVFIVSELADIINCEYKGTPGFHCNDINNVDLIYFPTGGGKTETFLGCVIFAAFFDRIRGKENGVTSIIKYPLRLLAAQQLDRILFLTINANKIKKEYRIPGDDFSVGFFTGSKNTPNRIDDKKKEEIDISAQKTKNDNYRQIDICPICKKEMNIVFDEDRWVLKHVCSDPNCGFEPPIYIVDDEIYRYTPTFVISTIDKMANIGTSLGFKSLLGQSTTRCTKHGFLSYSGGCSVPKCRCELETDVDRKDPIPTLFIQDEMHLVNESLGTFDSHYESLIQYYCERLVPKEHRKTIKFIGATATISDFEKHIKGLYNKDAKKFPTSIKKENFYSRIDEKEISRIIIGAALYGGSITDSVQKITTLMRIIVSEWILNSSEKILELKKLGFSGNEEDLKSILNYYLIAIIYNNSKNDAGEVYTALENIGNNTLLAHNLPKFDIAEITGDVEFKTIKGVMHDVEASENKYETKNVIIATSAISHGVDEDCFNQIYFFGMPNQTSEYIQAYSRAGRKFTGIVFDIFRIVRDRDKSYLKNFYNFHEYKDLLINPVPINRYAKNAVYSTVPGIVAALLYHCYVKKSRAIDVTKAINNGALTLDLLLQDVLNIYECDSQDSKLYKEIITTEVTKIFNAFKANTNSDIKISDLIKNATTRHKGPMTNLRDVDVPLEVAMKGN